MPADDEVDELDSYMYQTVSLSNVFMQFGYGVWGYTVLIRKLILF